MKHASNLSIIHPDRTQQTRGHQRPIGRVRCVLYINDIDVFELLPFGMYPIKQSHIIYGEIADDYLEGVVRL